MSVKTESESNTNAKVYTKKLYCPEHGNKFSFKCEYAQCPSPYVCHFSECIESHFHFENGNKLILAKFDSLVYANQLGELETLFTKQDFAAEAKKLKNFIDGLKNDMVAIHRDYKDLQNRKQSLAKEGAEKTLSQSFMKEVRDTLDVGFNLKSQLNALKAKLHLASTYPVDQQNHQYQQLQQIQVFSKQSNMQNQIESHYNNVESDNHESVDKSKSKSAHVSDGEESQSIKRSERMLNDSSNCFESDARSSGKKDILDLNNKYKSFDDLFSQDINQNKKTVPQPLSQVKLSTNKYSGNLNLAIYQKNFYLKKQLTIFLQKNIENFSWGLVEQIYSSSREPKSCQRFHQMLQGKNNLLFIFVGDKTVIGSFYPSRYPKITEKLRFDNKSFLFVSDQNKSFHKFKAMLSQFHLSISERMYICHGNTPSYADGIRTFQKNFESLNYCLPSFSYKYDQLADQQEAKDFNGVLKVRQFFILQCFTSKQKV